MSLSGNSIQQITEITKEVFLRKAGNQETKGSHLEIQISKFTYSSPAFLPSLAILFLPFVNSVPPELFAFVTLDSTDH